MQMQYSLEEQSLIHGDAMNPELSFDTFLHQQILCLFIVIIP